MIYTNLGSKKEKVNNMLTWVAKFIALWGRKSREKFAKRTVHMQKYKNISFLNTNGSQEHQ